MLTKRRCCNSTSLQQIRRTLSTLKLKGRFVLPSANPPKELVNHGKSREPTQPQGQVKSRGQAKSRFHHLSFYNDELKVFRPFDNVVKLNFGGNTSGGMTYRDPRILKKKICNPDYEITGITVTDKGKTAYVSLVDEASKSNMLSANISIPDLVNIENYDVVSLPMPGKEKAFRPFRYSAVVSFRPSVVSEGKLVVYLSQFGSNCGKEIISCPYDNDRKFMYFAYNSFNSLSKATKNPDISPYHVYHDGIDIDTAPENDIFVYRFTGHDKTEHGTIVEAVSKGLTNTQLLIEDFSRNYGEISTTNQVWTSQEYQKIRVSFRDPYAVYRMFYRTSQFGRLSVPQPAIGNTENRTVVTVPWEDKGLSHGIVQERLARKRRHEIILTEVFDAPQSDPEELLRFCNSFLDEMECNPGIVAGLLLTQHSISLKFANEWHSAHVAHRLRKLRREGIHDYNVRVDEEWNNLLSKYFHD